MKNLQSKLKVFYDPRQVVLNNQSFSPSAGKPKLLLDEIHENRPAIQGVIELTTFQPLNKEDFYLVHLEQHVDDILGLNKPNGFQNKSKEVADSLFWTNGSFVRAAEWSCETGLDSMSPTSGFHHAETDLSEGFCTFNGLMIAAAKLFEKKAGIKIGIIDFDAHFGNGTEEIIKRKGWGQNIVHYTFGDYAPFWQKTGGNARFQRWVDELDKDLYSRDFTECDIFFYQAGADPFIEDPYGGYLTMEQMARRDEAVFRFAKKNKIPIVWNLAGGYTNPLSKVLDIHVNTFEKWLLVQNEEISDGELLSGF